MEHRFGMMALTAGILIAHAAQSARAQDVTLYFTAKVASVDDREGALGGSVKEGDEITGSYTYNLGTPDDNDASTVGDYWHRTRPYGISVNAGGRRFFTNPDKVEFLVELCDNHGYPASDNYLLRSYKNLVEPALPSGGVDHIAWQLDDATLKALSSADLTAKPPVIADWESAFGLTIDGCAGSSSGSFCMDQFFIRAHVTSVGPVPPAPGKLPVAHWSFDAFHGGMVSLDATGHGHELACLQGRAGLKHVEGARGKALELPGKGFELAVAESRGAFNFAQGTLETILHYLPGEEAQTLFSNATCLPGVLRGWELQVDAGGRLSFRQGNEKISKKWFTTSAKAALGPRKAYHVAATFTRKQVALYVNGKLAASGPAIQYLPSVMKAYVGHGYAPIAQYRNPVRGSLDEMKLYDAALDAAAIKARYEAARSGIEAFNALNARR